MFICLINKKYLYIMLNKFDVIRSFAVKKRGIITGAFVTGVISTGCSVIIPLFIGQYYNIVFHSQSSRGAIFEKLFGHIESVTFFLIVFGLFLLFRLLLTFLEKYFIGLTGESFSNSIRQQLFSKQLHTELSTFESKDTGVYLLRYSGDLKSVQDYLTKGIIQFCYDCFFMLGAFILLYILNAQLAFIFALAIPVLLITNAILNKRLKAITGQRRNLKSRNLAFVATRLKSVLTIKLFNRESIEADKYNKRSTELFKIGKKYQAIAAFMQALYPFILYTSLLAILWVAYLQVNSDNKIIDGSTLVTFIMLVISIIPVFKRLLRVNMIWVSGNVSFSKLLLLFNANEENKAKTPKINRIKGSLKAEGISFKYSNDFVLQNINFTIEPGTITSLAGPQGSGKSTLFKLITGLYPLEKGKLFIDNYLVAEISKHILRKNITIISDNLPLLGRTYFEAVSYSRKEKNRAAAKALLTELGIFAGSENDILNKQIIDGGRNISNGEKKLLNIARALLTNKKIILMDEPFTDLSPKAIDLVCKCIEKRRGKHTIIIADNLNINIAYDNRITLHEKISN